MARTSAKAKKQKQDVSSVKTEATNTNEIEKEEENPANDNEDTTGSTDKENDNTNYEVEKIVHSRVYHGKRQFLVRWKGYKEDSDTWENESMLQSCSEVLEAFQRENPKLIEKLKDDSDSDTDKGSDVDVGKKRTKKESKKAAIKKFKKNVEPQNEATSDSEDPDENDDENKDKDNQAKKKKSKKAIKTSEKPNQKMKEVPKKKSKHSDEKDDKSDDSESDTDGKNYEVEKILEVHTRKNGNREFLIRWKGYRPSDDTWEPEEHLDCPDLIEKFMERVDKAKSMPVRELRESRTPTKRYVPNNRSKKRSSQRQGSIRPCYQE